MSNPPYLKGFAALFAHAVFLAVSIDLVSNSGRLVALGANNLNLAGSDRAFGLNYTGRVAGLAGLNVLLNLVKTLNNNLTFFRTNLKYLTGLAAVFIVSCEKDYLENGLSKTLAKIPLMSPDKIDKDDLLKFILRALDDDPILLSVDGKGHQSRSQMKKCISIWDWLTYSEAAKDNIKRLDSQTE